MKTTKLTTSPAWNPFQAPFGEISSIVFYKDGKIICSVKWFGSNNNYKSITLPFEVKKALKLNLFRRDAFYMIDKEETYFRRYLLYICADLVNLKSLGRKNISSTWYGDMTAEEFTAEITGERKQYIKTAIGYDMAATPGTYSEKFLANYITIDSELYKHCKDLAAKLNACTNRNLCAFDVYEILQKFDIKEK